MTHGLKNKKPRVLSGAARGWLLSEYELLWQAHLLKRAVPPPVDFGHLIDE